MNKIRSVSLNPDWGLCYHIFFSVVLILLVEGMSTKWLAVYTENGSLFMFGLVMQLLSIMALSVLPRHYRLFAE